jgi:hypothetical protein
MYNKFYIFLKNNYGPFTFKKISPNEIFLHYQLFSRRRGEEEKKQIIQQNIDAIRNRELEVFLKNSIDNIEFFCERKTRNCPLYNVMINSFITVLRNDVKWTVVFSIYKVYRNDFQRFLIVLPFLTQEATDDTIFRETVCPNFLRFFRKKKKHIDYIKFPHCMMIWPREEKGLCIFYANALKKPKHLAKFGKEWEIIRKYGILTKKKYANLYLKNPDVYEVLVYEEIKKRSLEYYTEFVEKIIRQYLLKVSDKKK